MFDTTRPGEVHGVHYHYTSMEGMKALIDNGEFVEFAKVHNNLYGTRWVKSAHISGHAWGGRREREERL